MTEAKKNNRIRDSLKMVKTIYEYMKGNNIKSISFLDRTYPADSEKLELLYNDGNAWVVFGDEMKDVDKRLPKVPTEKELIFQISKLFYPSMTTWDIQDDKIIGFYTRTVNVPVDGLRFGKTDIIFDSAVIGIKVDGHWKLPKDMSDLLFKDETFHII